MVYLVSCGDDDTHVHLMSVKTKYSDVCLCRQLDFIATSGFGYFFCSKAFAFVINHNAQVMMMKKEPLRFASVNLWIDLYWFPAVYVFTSLRVSQAVCCSLDLLTSVTWQTCCRPAGVCS